GWLVGGGDWWGWAGWGGGGGRWTWWAGWLGAENLPAGGRRDLARVRHSAADGYPDGRRVSKIGVSTHIRTLGPAVIADLDTLLTALYVELTDRIIPSLGLARSGPGRPPEVTDAELVCLAVAPGLLRSDAERRGLR